MTILYNKKKYVFHYVALKQYISLGLKFKKIHKILEFKQSAWLKVFIDFNTDLKMKAKNDFEKD